MIRFHWWYITGCATRGGRMSMAGSPISSSSAANATAGQVSRPVIASRDPVARLARLDWLRSAEHSGRIGSYRQLPAPADVWAFQAGDLNVTANFSARPVDVGPPAGPVVASSSPGALRGTALAPWAGVITRPAR